MTPATAENGWINTLDSDNPEVIAKAHRIISSIHYCTLSTCSPDGFPWVSPIFFAYDDHWNIFWSSAIAAKHSQNLYCNQGRALIAIYDSTKAEGKGEGLYLAGSATQVDRDSVADVMQRLFKRAGSSPDRTPQDYLDASPRRIYCFQPQEVWITGERVVIGNQLVDTKIPLSLSAILAQK